MATIKSFSDLQQSKKLAEILPLESADMFYCYGMDIETGKCEYDKEPSVNGEELHIDVCDIPAWSLSALLSVLPFPSLHKTFMGYRCDSYNEEGTTCKLGESADNPVDACYELILKLHELKML